MVLVVLLYLPWLVVAQLDPLLGLLLFVRYMGEKYGQNGIHPSNPPKRAEMKELVAGSAR